MALIVQDDGRGLQQDDGEILASHFGLQGVRERVVKLGAVLDIQSRPGLGTRLAVTLPVRSRDSAASAGRDVVPRRHSAPLGQSVH